ncbi:MAG: hypothetical protein ACI3ZC_04330, partial [Candidatus Cryptobacteroides sp.]
KDRGSSSRFYDVADRRLTPEESISEKVLKSAAPYGLPSIAAMRMACILPEDCICGDVLILADTQIRRQIMPLGYMSLMMSIFMRKMIRARTDGGYQILLNCRNCIRGKSQAVSL